ncbi:MFS transporter [Nonomuraea recticatena]|uniref:DHA2 family efflux MFS transporter permease subunit n=1 Tax=Nonomuraea recticatena TaxID=46178 RepID=A0ABP6DKC0_9ACTN
MVLVLLCLAQFMLIIDITVVQVALPSIGTGLGLDREALTWVVTAYTLCFGGLMVLGGRLTDAFGARRVLLGGLALFTLASLLCGLAPDGATLIAGRALQGVGAALLSPAALATITTAFHGERRTRALAVWAAIGGTGAAVGVLVGGLLTAGPGWEWAFFVNVPVGLVVMAALPSLVPASATAERRPLDVPGALLVTAATGLLIYGLVSAGEAGWGSASAWLAGSAALYAAFVWAERVAKAPLMRAETMARRPVLSGVFVMLMATGLMLGLFFVSSLYLQQVLRFSALETGLLFLPVAISITLGAHLGGRLIGRVGGRPVAVAAFLLTAAGALLMTRVSPEAGVHTTLLPGFVLAAFGIGPAFVAATATTMANVPQGEAGVASGVVNTFHELGGSIGVALVSSLAVGGFTTTLAWCAGAAAVAGVIALGLVPSGRPAALVGHGHGHGHGH